MQDWIFEFLQVECSHMADMAKQIVEANGLSNGNLFASLVLIKFFGFVFVAFISSLLCFADFVVFNCSHNGFEGKD